MKATKLILIFLISVLSIVIPVLFFTGHGQSPREAVPAGGFSRGAAAVPLDPGMGNNPVCPALPEPLEDRKNPSGAVSLPITLFPAGGIPVLMYHSISENAGNSLCVPIEQFEEEMRWLSREDYRALSAEELYRALAAGESIPEKSVLITFDDGYLDNYENAWPVLRQYGFHATFFIITDSIGYAEENGFSYMDWKHLRELAEAGNTVGSHSVSHSNLKSLSEEQQQKELHESKKILEEGLGITVSAFCFPYGKYNSATLRLMEASGYRIGFTTKNGKAREGDNPLEIQRIRVYQAMPLPVFIRQVS